MTLVSKIYETVPHQQPFKTHHQLVIHKQKLAQHLRKHPPRWEREVWAILKPLGFTHRAVLQPSLVIAQFADRTYPIVVEVNSPKHDYLEPGVQDRLDTIRSGYKLLLFRRDQNLAKEIPARVAEARREIEAEEQLRLTLSSKEKLQYWKRLNG